MNVADCMSRNVRIASPKQTIRDAAQTMMEIDAGFLPVGENDRLVGMITDRDIAVRAVAAGKDANTPIRDIMTKEVLYCFEDDELNDVATRMAELQVRRMPVLNQDKRLVGVISIGDISQSDTDNGAWSAIALTGVSAPGGQHTQH